MNYKTTTEDLLKKYNLHKERLDFLQCQVHRMTPEQYDDYIEHKMYQGGVSGRAPRFIMEKGHEVAQLNTVEETAVSYRTACEKEYTQARKETEREIKELVYITSLVEDGLEVMGRVNEKYRFIIEKYYIRQSRMEEIAECLHICRSRCYVMCKEGVKWMARILYGSGMVG